MAFRQLVFWLHLACGVAAGLVIGLLFLTDVALVWHRFFPKSP